MAVKVAAGGRHQRPTSALQKDGERIDQADAHGFYWAAGYPA